ncbi:MAG: hypothetical protein KAI66_07600, partial [Lentisphaeria bacterium]|nr:hypothetical protein [Lentisphaeria bacterium]
MMNAMTLLPRKHPGHRMFRSALLVGLVALATARTHAVEAYAEVDTYRTILSEGGLKGSVPDVAVDYLENSHVVWRDGREVYYAKMSKDGAMLAKNAADEAVPALRVGRMALATFMPSITVDFDGAAHILAPGPSGLLYVKINPDGALAFTRGVRAGTFIRNIAEYRGGDIALDPIKNLPVVATLLYTSNLTFIGGYPFYRYWESIR